MYKFLTFSILFYWMSSVCASEICQSSIEDDNLVSFEEECCKVAKEALKEESNIFNKKFNESFDESFSIFSDEISQKIEELKKEIPKDKKILEGAAKLEAQKFLGLIREQMKQRGVPNTKASSKLTNNEISNVCHHCNAESIKFLEDLNFTSNEIAYIKKTKAGNYTDNYSDDLISTVSKYNKAVDNKNSIARLEKYQEKLTSNKERARIDLAQNCPGKGSNFSINIGMTHQLVASGGAFCESCVYRASTADEMVREARDSGWNYGVNQERGQTVDDFGSFEKREQAEEVQKQIEQRDDYALCSVESVETSKKEVGPRAPVKVTNLFGTEDFFGDNSKELSSDSEAYLEEGLEGLENSTDSLKVKIYTCSSMYKNCAEDNSPTCHDLTMMRNYTDDSLLKSTGTSRELKQVLSHPDYKKAVASMQESPFSTDIKEQRLWVALSMMRALEVEKVLKKKLGNRPGIKFELIPTGHPDDPFNNQKLDSALSGTCGPLPKEGTDSYYGDKSGECEARSHLSEVVKNRDLSHGDKYQEYYQKTFPDKEIKKGELNYSAHRYAKVEIEKSSLEGAKVSQEGIKVQAWNVSCARIVNSCEKWKKGFPHIRLPKIPLPSISLKGYGGYYNRGKSKKTGCYFK